MRLIEKLKEYDDSITVGELLTELKQAQELAEQEDLELEDFVKSKFENTYLKVADSDSIYGRELNIIEFKNFVKKERTTNWDFVYYFEGSKMSLSDKSLFQKDFDSNRCENSFSLRDLKEMTKITETEYLEYKKEFEFIKNRLKNLL